MAPSQTTALFVVEDDDTIGVPLVEGRELQGFPRTRVRTASEDEVDPARFLETGATSISGRTVLR